MHLLFLDESGTPHGPNVKRERYFVLGGISIPDGVWRKLNEAVHGLKVRRKIIGEIKWRYFAPSNTDALNPFLSLGTQERDEVREELYRIICSTRAVKTIACVVSIEAAYLQPHIATADDLYSGAYKPLSERFQYHLQDVSRMAGRPETGVIVADHRGAEQDKRLRNSHERLIKPSGMYTSNYKNLVESLFFLPSDLSLGIQLADMVAARSGVSLRKAMTDGIEP